MFNKKVILAYGIPALIVCIFKPGAMFVSLPIMLLAAAFAFIWYQVSRNEGRKQTALYIIYPLFYGLWLLFILVAK
ncbi:MAG: hypothetical protein IKU13_08730 [Clostridia bacterium]|nr:hypothetical protein [Clostridia bacterium]